MDIQGKWYFLDVIPITEVKLFLGCFVKQLIPLDFLLEYVAIMARKTLRLLG